MAEALQDQYEHEKVTSPAEELRVLDELAGIRMMQDDIQTKGYVTPETWQQVYNEEITFVAEGINAPLYTRFILDPTESGLVNERGKLFMQSLWLGLGAAEQEAKVDPRLGFRVRRALHDYQEGQAIEAMVRGETEHNTIVSVSPFCDEAYQQHGTRFTEDAGYQPERLMAFIRVYNRTETGKLEVHSVSVDNSDLEAFSGLLKAFGKEVPAATISDDYQQFRLELNLDADSQQALPGQLRQKYDDAMGELYGKEFRAGRLVDNEIEAWGFIEKQKDLAQRYMNRLEVLARSQPNNRQAKRELTYGFWAALKDRYKAASRSSAHVFSSTPKTPDAAQALDQEMSIALNSAVARHERMIGCGGSIEVASGKTNLLDESPENALSSIMNNKEGKWAWKRGVCRVTGCSTRPHTTEVGPCNVCRQCQHKFDAGQDPTKK